MDRAGLSRWVRRWQVRFPGLVAGGLCVVAALAAAAAPTPPGGPVTRFGGDLFGVDAASPSAAWAVGDTELNHHSATVLLHWDGKSWTRAAGPLPGTLWAVKALSPANAWAAGDLETATTFETLVLHWNGTTWRRVASPSPGPPPVADDLYSVDAVSPANVWAVGDLINNGPGPTFKTLVLHWNGTKWARVASPNPSRQWDSLSGVSVISRNDAWAVGNSAKGGDASQNLILHWNGRAWAQVASPDTGDSSLGKVAAVSPTDVWAVGETISRTGVHKTLVLYWNGTRWARLPSPNPSPSDSELSGVSAVSSSDVWADGVFFDNQGHAKTLILHWNGTRWSRVPSPSPAGLLGSNLVALSALAPGNVWAVGNVLERGNDQTLVLHWNGTHWARS